jgi:alkylation response protein AidB-like acyl-CoA dehydrogenase
MGPAVDWKKVLATLAPAFSERGAAYDNNDEFVDGNYADMRAARLFSSLVPQELGGRGLAYSEACA